MNEVLNLEQFSCVITGGIEINSEIGQQISKYLSTTGLGSKQKTMLHSVLTKYAEVYVDRLGLTDKYVHEIKMSSELPFLKRSYPIAFSHREIDRK